MLFYDDEGLLHAYIRNRGFVCVEADSARRGDDLRPGEHVVPTNECLVYTNPYGDLMLTSPRLAWGEAYNTVLQEIVEADWSNLFSVDDGEVNPYTEMLHGDVDAELLIRSDAWCRVKDKTHDGAPVRLSYDSKSKTISVYNPSDGCDEEPTHLFDMRKDEFIDTFMVECVD